LAQLTALAVPALAAGIGGEAVSRVLWAASAAGAAGAYLVAADGSGATATASAAAAAAPDTPAGAALMLTACLFYAAGTVRLGSHAPRFPPAALAAATAAAAAALAAGWLALESAACGGPPPGAQLAALAAEPSRAAALLWLGVGPGAVASVLQAAGQRTVSPTTAQLVYSLTPVFSAVLAALAGERLGAPAALGAALILLASLAASLRRDPP